MEKKYEKYLLVLWARGLSPETVLCNMPAVKRQRFKKTKLEHFYKDIKKTFLKTTKKKRDSRQDAIQLSKNVSNFKLRCIVCTVQTIQSPVHRNNR